MGKGYSILTLTGFLLALFIVSAPSHARNVVGGASDTEAEEKADDVKADKEATEEEKAAAAEKEKKQKEAEEKQRKAEEAERKAEQEAKEAALKKAADIEKRKQEVEIKKKRKQREKQENLLKSVKSNRQYARQVEGHNVLISVTPGGGAKNNVVEITFQVNTKAEGSIATTQILSKLKEATATVTTLKRRKRGGGETYKLHRISRAGTYGFHYTPVMNGTYNVELKATVPNGPALVFDVPLYTGVWPPPDFPAEEKAYEAATQGSSKSRRVMDTE
jgi:Skp family chaperone for outer membrane proteins